MDPTVRYATTSDGVTIAYTVLGDGPALVAMPSGLLSNLAALRRIPSVARAYERLSAHLRVVLYDGRGTGSSQRDVDAVGPEAMIHDLEAVVAQAGLESFALLGYYFTVGTAITYAQRQPERVTKLVLFDEIMAGLTPTEVSTMTKFVGGLPARGITVIWVEHVLYAIMKTASRIMVLNRGELIANGEPAAIARDPAVVKAYLGEEISLA